MTQLTDLGERINELTELMGLMRFRVVMRCDREVKLEEMNIDVQLLNQIGGTFKMPIDFKPVTLAAGKEYSIVLPIQVENV